MNKKLVLGLLGGFGCLFTVALTIFALLTFGIFTVHKMSNKPIEGTYVLYREGKDGIYFLSSSNYMEVKDGEGTLLLNGIRREIIIDKEEHIIRVIGQYDFLYNVMGDSLFIASLHQVVPEDKKSLREMDDKIETYNFVKKDSSQYKSIRDGKVHSGKKK